jgi:nitrogenase iron protein NifH
MRLLVINGKGGIGKSTVTTNLALLFARSGRRVLLLGCDPKGDSCYSLVAGQVVTLMDRWAEQGDAGLSIADCIVPGRGGVDCLEAGGPKAGSGCAGSGISKALELARDADIVRVRYDVVLLDVLGETVCGGFSEPLGCENPDEVYIVTSGERKSLSATNAIAEAVRKHAQRRVRLGGLVGNLRGLPGEADRISRLAQSIGSTLTCCIPHDPTMAAAEHERIPIVDYAPESPATLALLDLQRKIAARSPGAGKVPTPLTVSQIDELFVAE